MVIVESTVWIDYFSGVENAHTVWLEEAFGRQKVGLVDLILAEVLQGVKDERRFVQVERELRTLEVYDTGGAELAVMAARNYRLLRKRGRTVRTTIDCLIATYCLAHGHALLHRDRDYTAFEDVLGLRVVHPQVQ